jgi:hypothetical protein
MRAALVPLAALAALLAAVLALGGIDCSVYLGTCTCAHCCTNGTCSSGPWSGTVCGCGTGDPELPNVDNKCTNLPPWPAPNGNARKWLEDRGYCRSFYGTSYSDTDFTKRADSSGRCRYQAIITPDNKAIAYRDGPEPNPQPAFACNGNPDLWWPWGCERYTIEEWHRAC